MNNTKYIYILSQRYSGSTLLSFLLGTHKDISTIGERRKFYIKSLRPDLKDVQKCSCGVSFQRCNHWNTIKNGLLERLDLKKIHTNFTEFQIFKNKYANRIANVAYEFCLIHGFPKSLTPFRSKIKKLNEYNLVLVKEIMKADQRNVFLDSSKSINQILFLSQIPTIDLQVVWLTRDPRAQVNSTLKYNNWTIEKATENWKKEMVNNERILKKLKIKHTVLSYESLCRNPKDEISKVLNFVGLDSSSFSLDFRKKTQHIMGNYSMRLGNDNKITERKDWQKTLSNEQIKSIENMTVDYKKYYSPHIKK